MAGQMGVVTPITNKIQQTMEQIVILKEIHQIVHRLRMEELSKEETNLIILQLAEEVIKKEEQLTNQVMFLKGEVDRLSSL